jgi:threonylcarbamoyladenosine tRNA methylthiotransferase MtaB
LRRIEHFITLGFKEVVLSGIDITSYGKDLTGNTFSNLVESILKNTTIERLRISSIDPKGIDEKLLDLIAQESRIMPHFHLSIQSGDDAVLRSMRRRHTREDVIRICENILEKRPEVVFGCDFIAGFPTETDEMFQNTLNLVDEAHLSLLHIFPYSPRKGTLAAQMIQLSKKAILERAQLLRNKAQSAQKKLLESFVGTMVSGMIERSEKGFSYGKTDSFVAFAINADLPPRTVVKDALVTRTCEQTLMLG